MSKANKFHYSTENKYPETDAENWMTLPKPQVF